MVVPVISRIIGYWTGLDWISPIQKGYLLLKNECKSLENSPETKKRVQIHMV
jgi:hypothetical protein